MGQGREDLFSENWIRFAGVEAGRGQRSSCLVGPEAATSSSSPHSANASASGFVFTRVQDVRCCCSGSWASCCATQPTCCFAGVEAARRQRGSGVVGPLAATSSSSPPPARAFSGRFAFARAHNPRCFCSCSWRGCCKRRPDCCWGGQSNSVDAGHAGNSRGRSCSVRRAKRSRGVAPRPKSNRGFVSARLPQSGDEEIRVLLELSIVTLVATFPCRSPSAHFRS